MFRASDAVEYQWYAACHPTICVCQSVSVELSSLYRPFFFALGKNCRNLKRAMGVSAKRRNLRYPNTFVVLIASAFRDVGTIPITSWIYKFPFAQFICTFTLVILCSAQLWWPLGRHLNRVRWRSDCRPETFPGLQIST